jgi:formate dehydrogenase accessory protein FdhE
MRYAFTRPFWSSNLIWLAGRAWRLMLRFPCANRLMWAPFVPNYLQSFPLALSVGPNLWVLRRGRQLVEAALTPGEASSVAAEDFFVRVCLQPMAENLQRQLPKDRNYNQNVCPVCGGLPQMALLRPEGEGASRSLWCSFCLCEWHFRRIVCPWCGEEDKEKLPHYSSEAWKYVHVEACDNCQRYLKAVDMTIDGLAVPLVDEAALAVLDVWASGLGYTKIIRNMIGF